MQPLFWWEPPSAGGGLPPTLAAGDVAAACGAPSARFLGRGSFGETWHVQLSASAAGTGGDVAVKIVLNPSYPMHLLQREVSGLSRVTNQHVVALRELRDLTLPVGVRPALLFEFVTGGDVEGALLAGQAPTGEQVLSFARGLLTGVAALHATDTVHRDIKPANVALRDGDWSRPVLLDLGLAKLLDAESITQYPALMGTLPYMAPEQVRQEPARKQADIWATGVVLYVLLSGQHPFFDARPNVLTDVEALDRMSRGPRPLPAGAPAELANVVLRLLNHEPFARGSAARAVRDLT